MSIVDKVELLVSMRDVCDRFGIEVDRNGFTHCVFHNGDHTPSLQIFLDENAKHQGYRCFACQANGRGVIDFYKQYYKIGFSEAVRKIDMDFNLNLFRTKPSRQEILKEQARVFHRKQEAEAKKEKYERLKKLRDEALTEYSRLERNIEIYRPRVMCLDLDPLFVEGLENIHWAKHCYTMADLAVQEMERELHGTRL